MTPWWVRLSVRFRRRQVRQLQVQSIEVQGLDRLREVLNDGRGVMITPNHSAHYDSAALYLAADLLRQPLYYMTAWQVFGMSSAWEQWAMQRLGCFSVDRESTDRKAFKQALRVLQEEPHPLVIFPEGDIYHTTDHVTRFREGAAAIAMAAAKRSKRPIVAMPCGVKFWYVEDPTPELEAAAIELEERVLLRPLQTAPLRERIHRLAESVLALKELDYLGRTREGRLRERIPFLIEAVLAQLEKDFLSGQTVQPAGADARVPERVKQLRQTIISELQQLEENAETRMQSAARRRQLAEAMDDLFFAMQLYSYPGDYLIDDPTIERLAETLDKFEEDILQLNLPRIRGTRRVVIRFGEPIEIAAKKGQRESVRSLTLRLQESVQGLVNSLNDEKNGSPPNTERVVLRL